MIMTPHVAKDGIVRLPDGRQLGYAESGASDGFPVLFVPGYGHSRLACGDVTASTRVGVRVISVDLPGIGVSDRAPGYTLQSWVDDLAALLEDLGVDRCSVAGWSWGAPYALASAMRLPKRIATIGVISGLTGWLAGPGAVREVRPEFRTFATWCRHLRPAARAFTAFQARGFRADPDGTVRKEAGTTGGDDAEVAADAGVLAMLVASAHEVWDRGGAGTYDHSLAVTQPWGFDVADVGTHVEIWHGSDDREIHPAMAAAAVRLLPDASLHLVEGRGHLLVFAEWGPILESLMPSTVR